MIESVSLNSSQKVKSTQTIQADGSASAGFDFAHVMNDVVQGAADQVKAGEAAAISGLRGQIPAQDVVEAVMSAERALQTALAVRDKTVAAWQEISRMSI